MQDDINFLEDVYGKWEKRLSQPNAKKEIDDNLDDESRSELKIDTHFDSFTDSKDFIEFINFIQNPYNLRKIKDKHQFRLFFKKYRELIDLTMGIFPFIKSTAKNFHLIVPNVAPELNETQKRQLLKTSFQLLEKAERKLHQKQLI